MSQPDGSMQEVLLPRLGEAVTHATILEWFVGADADVDAGQALVEITTDKVETTVEAPVAGRVVELRARPDEEVAVGSVIAVIQTKS